MAENKYDKGYKRILGKKKNFLSLLKNFIKTSWINELTEDDLEIIDKEFIPKDFREKESDLIYKIRIKEKEIIIYFLMELQSSVDFTMPYRLLMYMTELYKRIFMDTDEKERERKGFQLPAIVPVVLYNGSDSWSVVNSFKEYLSGYPLFEENVINFKYILLNVNNYSDEVLYEIGNLISSVFTLDKKQDKDRFVSNITKLAKLGMKLSQEEQIDLADWLRDVLKKKAVSKGHDEIIDVLVKNLLEGEVTPMTYAIERIFDEEREDAREDVTVEIAIKMLKKNKDIDEIQEFTSLSYERIMKLRQQLDTKE